MKKCHVAMMLFVLCGCSVIVGGQVPPPPPSITSAPQALREKWESPDGGFKVRFPGRPKASVKASESAFGPVDLHSFILSTSLAFYSVTYIDFPTAITDKYDLDTRFETARDEQVKRLSARVMADHEWFFGSYYGRAYVLETATQTVTVRALAAGPRVFMLFVITQGRQSAARAPVATGNKTRIDAFLDSFEITKLPEPKTKQVQLPEDFQVVANNRSFSSAFLGVSLIPPSSWVLSAQEDAELLMELGKEETARTNPRLADHLSNENFRLLAVYSPSSPAIDAPSAFLLVLAERAPFPNFAPTAAAKDYEKLYLEPTEKVTKPVATKRLGDREFAWIETFDSESKTYSRIYFGNINGIALEFLLTFSKPADLTAMLKALATVKFANDNSPK